MGSNPTSSALLRYLPKRAASEFGSARCAVVAVTGAPLGKDAPPVRRGPLVGVPAFSRAATGRSLPSGDLRRLARLIPGARRANPAWLGRRSASAKRLISRSTRPRAAAGICLFLDMPASSGAGPAHGAALPRRSRRRRRAMPRALRGTPGGVARRRSTPPSAARGSRGSASAARPRTRPRSACGARPPRVSPCGSPPRRMRARGREAEQAPRSRHGWASWSRAAGAVAKAAMFHGSDAHPAAAVPDPGHHGHAGAERSRRPPAHKAASGRSPSSSCSCSCWPAVRGREPHVRDSGRWGLRRTRGGIEVLTANSARRVALLRGRRGIASPRRHGPARVRSWRPSRRAPAMQSRERGQ